MLYAMPRAKNHKFNGIMLQIQPDTYSKQSYVVFTHGIYTNYVKFS